MTRLAIDWTQPTALYRLLDRAGGLLYLGIAQDPEKRFREHARTKPWWPDVASRQTEWYDNRWTADEAETIAIAVEQPLRNDDRKNAPMVDFTPRRSHAGIYNDLRDELVAAAVCAVTAPPPIAEVIGIPDSALCFHALHVYQRDDVHLWSTVYWEYPGFRGSIEERWSALPSPPPSASTRAASAVEAAVLGLTSQASVDARSFTGPCSRRQRRSYFAEAAWPAGARAEHRKPPPRLYWEREQWLEAKGFQAQKDAASEARDGRGCRSGHEQAASALVRAARLALGVDREQFAARLDAELGWTVNADTVARWERASTPPGGVVALCATLADWPPC